MILKKINLIILLTFFITCCSFKVVKNINTKVAFSLRSDIFVSYFKLCKRNQDTIYVFNNSNEKINRAFIKIKCNKILVLNNYMYDYDINNPSLDSVRKILIYKYESSRNGYRISFIETKTNSTIDLIFNNKNKLINYKKGAF